MNAEAIVKAQRAYFATNATLTVVEKENHLITLRRKQVIALTVDFFKQCFNLGK